MTEIPSSSTSPDRRAAMSHYRWVVCILLFFSITINYMDRQVLGILKPMLSDELDWSEEDYGAIVMCFSFSYATGYLFVGRIMDAVGVRVGLSLMVGIWSLFGMGHALARSVVGFCVARTGLGLAEGGNFPAATKSISEWFPKKERALAFGIANAGSNVGAVVTPITIPWLVELWGWQGAFIALGLTGFAWVALWMLSYGQPLTHQRVNQAERDHILTDPPDPPARVGWLQLVGHRQTWAFVVGMVLCAPIWWFYLYWVPDFFSKNYHLNLFKMMGPLVAVYVLADVGSIGGGWLSSWLIHRGWRVGAARKTAMLACALCVVPVGSVGWLDPTHTGNLWLATFLIGLAAAAHQGFAANLFTLVSDTVPRKAVSSVVGIGGMAGSLAAMPMAWFVGRVLGAAPVHGYTILFAIASTAYLFNVAVIHAFNPRHTPMQFPDSAVLER
ncbi:MFS transporter [bacterium]|nr:MFS transporter [bacterium]